MGSTGRGLSTMMVVMAALSLMTTVYLATGSETLAAGGDHACLITTTGGVKCWGLNSDGQLGYEDTVQRGDDDDTLGDALGFVDLGTDRTAVCITAGDAHTCAVLDDGSLKCWGSGEHGQLGQGDPFSHGSAIYTMGDSLDPVDLGTDPSTGSVRRAKKAAAGSGYTCVLTEDAQVACFGRNDMGQLGIEHSDDIGKEDADMGDNLQFVDFGSTYTGRAVDISSGPCALFDDGRVKCWGNNLYGSAGVPGSVDVGLKEGDMGDNLPVVPLGVSTSDAGVPLAASLVASGPRHNCAIVDAGMVKCWGKNTQGNLGLGNVHDLGNDEDELGDDLPYTDLGADAYRMDGGLDHTCALLTDGIVKCWGKNWAGALGLGDFRTRGDYPGEMGEDLPAVFLGTDRTAAEISAGNDFSCAVLDDGSVKCWGNGTGGKLGQGSSWQLGDDPSEMENLSSIDLGPGVLAAIPTLPTLAPTAAPTAAPTPSPTLAPVAPTFSPTAAPSAMTASPTEAPAEDGGGEREGPGSSGGGDGDDDDDDTRGGDEGEGGGDEVSAASQTTSDDNTSWQRVAVYVAPPLAAIALLAVGFAFFKSSRAARVANSG